MRATSGYVLKFYPPTAALLAAGLQDWQARGLLEGATLAIQVQQNGETDVTVQATTTKQMIPLVTGIAAWEASGLLATPIYCKLTVPQLSEQLLAGLDTWLQQGVVTDQAVRQFGQTYWWQPLPPKPVTAQEPRSLVAAYLLWALGFFGLCGLHRLYLGQIVPGLLWLFTLGLCGLGQLLDAFLLPGLTQRVNQQRGGVPQTVAPAPRLVMLRSLQAELSVLWLALVGVFLVVISSVVLAVQAWQALGAGGQYGVIWLYTLGFGGMGWWLRSKNNVPLTALMVQGVTLLLIPINFWMLDRLGLWAQGWPLGAGLALTGLALGLLRGQGGVSWELGGLLLLPWLHLGWQYPAVLYSAVYGGSVLTTAVLRRRLEWPSLWWVGWVGGMGLLLLRALVTLPSPDLALAMGLNGWWLVRLTQNRGMGFWAGWFLVLLGWYWANPLGLRPDGGWSWAAAGMVVVLGELLLQRLRHAPSFLALLGLSGLQLQGWWLLWVAIPEAGRAQIITWATGVGGTLGMPTVLLCVLWLPAVGVMLAARAWWQRQGAVVLARYSGVLALVLGSSLAVASLVNPTWRIVVWAGCGGYLWGWLRGQTQVQRRWIYLGHVLGWSTLLFWVDRVAPTLPELFWALLLFTLAAGLWCWSCTAQPWAATGWPVGLGLMVLGYGQWLTLTWVWGGHPGSGWMLSAFIPGIFLSLLSWQPRCVAPRWWVGVAVVTGVGSMVLLPPGMTTLGLSLATGIAGLGVWRWPHGFPGVVALSLGFALWNRLVTAWFTEGAWVAGVVWAYVLLVWAGRHYASRRREPVAAIYAQICEGWAALVTGIALIFFTYDVFMKYGWGEVGQSSLWQLWVMGVLTVGLGYRLVQQVQPWVTYGLAWSGEVWLAIGALYAASPWVTLGLGNAGLAVLSFLVLAWRRVLYRSIAWMPLVYGAIGVGVGLGTPLTATTGWTSVALGGVGLGINRQRGGEQLWVYFSAAVITLGLYQFLVYQLLQLPAGKAGDSWMVLAALAVVLSYGYGGLSRWLQGLGWLGLTARQALWIGHGHWGLAVGLACLRFLFPTSRQGVLGNAVVLLLCSVYALGYGRQQGRWVWVGWATLLAAGGDMLMVALPETTLVQWAGVVASGLGVGLMVAPWQRWGWLDGRPWQEWGLWLPGLNVLVIAAIAGGDWVTWPTLLVTAAFYAWAAQGNIRRSYASLVFLDWGVWKLLRAQGWEDFFIYGLLVGLSLLYLAQVDPYWQQGHTTRTQRHWLRCLATGLVGGTAIWESYGAWVPGWLTVGLGLGLAGLGLGLRVRAYLFVGTLIFVLQTVIQAWLFLTTYTFWLWVLGLGVLLLWVAATLETRRAQLLAWIQTLLRTGWADWE
jgi:TM2 domain-containing membrane protein YozV